MCRASAERSSVPALLWILSALTTSCASELPAVATPSDAAGVPLDAADAPADVPADVDPAIARGARVFRQFCAHCHGARGAGSGDGPDLRRGVPANTDDEVRRILREGGRMMPMVPIDDAQRADVFAFLRATFGPHQEP